MVILFIYLLVSAVTESYQNKSRSSMEGFIVGGKYASIKQFPHAVCLLHYPRYQFYCGSSVLNQHVLITASHCLEYNGYFTLDAYAGHEDLEKSPIIRKVDRYYKHENYDTETTANDIALLFIAVALPFGGKSHVKRVVITPLYPIAEKNAEISGWGYVNDVTKESSSRLKYTAQDIIPLEKCINDYLYVALPGTMCAGFPDVESNRPSKGDSGGGLVVKKYHQVGIVSFTTMEIPGLIFYCNVSYYYDWIVKQVEEKLCLGEIVKCGSLDCPTKYD